jgi:hypothetical protein
MNTAPIISIAAALLVAGCGDNSSKSGPATNSTSGNVLTAPVDYLKSAAKAEQSAVKTVDATALKSAIDMFNVQEGRYPKDLNELVQRKYMPKFPEVPFGSKIVYDASTGTVKIEKP